MKELAKFFSRRYSAVNTKDEKFEESLSRHRKSLNATRNLNGGLSIVDSFFRTRKEGKQTRWPKCSFLLMVVGLFAICAAIVIRILHPYDLVFRWKLILGEGGEIFNLWEKPPVDLYVKIYLFNITNAEEVLAGKEKMRVEEIGPYVYKEMFEHRDIEFNDNNTLSTRPKHPLVWQEEMSGGRSEDDVLMMVNIALLSIAQVAADKSYFFRLPVNVLIRQTDSQPIVKMTAREFMFGFETPLTTLGNTFLPNWIYFDKVGLVDRMYDFNADFETFYTGEDDQRKSGLYDSYMGSKNLPQWNGEHCSNIDMASDGTKFKSFIQPNESVKFFRKSMCRPQTMVPTGEEFLISNLKGYKYVFEDNALDNGYYNEKNKCYCRQGYCQPRGLIDVTDCYYGFPISLSYPHFMDADPKLLEDIDGLTPNRSDHESYFMIQPKSGLPLKCSVKLQINMHMRNLRSMNNVARFSDITIPMLWFEITMLELPEPLKNRFNLYLNILPYIDIIGFWGGLTVGIFCVLFAVTRATLRLSFISSKETCAGNSLYAKINLRSSVYKACEMKLMDINEKVIRRIEDDDMAMCEIDLKAEKNFILEQEPAISDDDEGNSSDSSQRTSEYSSDNNSNNQSISSDQMKSDSSSGFDSNRDPNENGNWAMGEASSLIDDIGNEHFPSLRITEEEIIETEEYTTEANV